MRYLRKYLQQVGLVSTMLIGGVLGGMLAPPPSDAETRPTVTFQVDTGTVSANLLNTSGTGLHGSTCTIPPGFSACYTLQTNGQFSGTNSKGVQRTFTIVNYDVTATPTTTGLPARVLVTDSGLLSVDIIKFSQMEVAPYPVTITNKVRIPVDWGASANTGATLPQPNYGEVHNLQFVITHRFDWNPNTATTTANNARYAFGMRFAGLFKGNLTGASASNDFAKFTGVGQFGSDTTETPLFGLLPPGVSNPPPCDNLNSKSNPLDINYCAMKKTLNITSAPTSSFGPGTSQPPALEQTSTIDNDPARLTALYPNYVCNNGNGGCTPLIKLTLSAAINGPDSWIFSDSPGAIGVSCRREHDFDRDWDKDDQVFHMKSCRFQNIAINTYNALERFFELRSFTLAHAEDTGPCVRTNLCLVLDRDLAPQTGTIKIIKNTSVTGACGGAELLPPCPSTDGTFAFRITDGYGGQPDFTPTVTVSGGGTKTEQVLVPPGNYNVLEELTLEQLTSGWSNGYKLCDDPDGEGTYISLIAGDIVTCTFNNSRAVQ